MRAFLVGWRAIVGYYNELFFLLGMSMLWWVTGGLFVLLAAILALGLFATGPWWIAPLVAIPAGPASAALAVVAKRVARGEHVDRSFYMEGLRAHWRAALSLSAIGMVVLALLLLNVLFYMASSNVLLVAFSLFWAYLAAFWMSIQLFIYPVLISSEEFRLLRVIRTAAVIAFANPLFTVLLLVVAIALTALSAVLAILLVIAWPALMALLGEYALRLVLQRAGMLEGDDTA